MAEMEQVGEDLDVGTYVSLVIRCIGNEVALKVLEAEVFEDFDSVLILLSHKAALASCQRAPFRVDGWDGARDDVRE